MNSLLPVNATNNERALESVVRSSLNFDLKDLTILPSKAPTHFLPYLALMFDIDISNMQENEQRKLIENALEIHRYKGTVYAVKKAIETSFDEVFIREWFNYNKEPYTFDIEVSIKADTSLIYNKSKFIKARELINSSKNGRSRFDNFIINLPKSKAQIVKNKASFFILKLNSPLALNNQDLKLNIKGGVTWQF